MLDLTPQRIGQLVRDGIIPPPIRRGRYETIPTVRAYLGFVKNGKRSAVEEIRTEQVLLVRAKRKAAEMEYEQSAGTLAPIDQMHAIMTEDYSAVRSKLLALPAKAAPRLRGADTLRINQILTDLVRETLTNIADDISEKWAQKKRGGDRRRR